MSFLQVSVFSSRQLGDYFPNQVARTKKFSRHGAESGRSLEGCPLYYNFLIIIS